MLWVGEAQTPGRMIGGTLKPRADQLEISKILTCGGQEINVPRHSLYAFRQIDYATASQEYAWTFDGDSGVKISVSINRGTLKPLAAQSNFAKISSCGSETFSVLDSILL